MAAAKAGQESQDSGPSIAPLTLCCGSFPLVIGVLLVCFIHALINILMLSLSSSIEARYISTIKITPFWQVVACAWALLGNPIIILAGVAAMFRVPWPLRVYLYYLICTVVIAISFFANIFWLADVCGSTVPYPIRKLGETIICSASNTLAFSSILVCTALCMYSVWVIWSCEKMMTDPDANLTLMKEPEEAEEEVEDKISQKFHFSPLDQTAYKWVDPMRAQMQLPPGQASVSQHLGGYGAYGSLDEHRGPHSSFAKFY